MEPSVTRQATQNAELLQQRLQDAELRTHEAERRAEDAERRCASLQQHADAGLAARVMEARLQEAELSAQEADQRAQARAESAERLAQQAREAQESAERRARDAEQRAAEAERRCASLQQHADAGLSANATIEARLQEADTRARQLSAQLQQAKGRAQEAEMRLEDTRRQLLLTEQAALARMPAGAGGSRLDAAPTSAAADSQAGLHQAGFVPTLASGASYASLVEAPGSAEGQTHVKEPQWARGEQVTDPLADNFGSQLADSFHRQRFQELLRLLMSAWHKDALEARAERKSAEQRQELEKLKQSQQRKGEQAAEQLAESFHRKRCQELLRLLVLAWHKETLEARAERKSDEQRQELEKLKQSQQRKGEQAAEQLAESFHRKRCQELLRLLVSAWHKDTLEARAERKSDEQRQELEKLKQSQQRKGEQAAEQLAESFHRKRCQELLRLLVSAWHKDALQARADKRSAEQQQELERLKQSQQSQQLRGEQATEQMAESFHRKHCRELLRLTVSAWHKEVLTAMAEENLRKASQAQRVKLDKLQDTMRERGQQLSLAMVEWFKQKHDAHLVRVVIANWHKDTLSEATIKRQRAAETQYRNEMERIRSEDQRKGTIGSQRMADRFHKNHMEAVLLEVIAVWHKAVLVLAAEDRENRAQRLAQREMEMLKRSQLLKGEQVAAKFQRKHDEAVLQAILLAWRNEALTAAAQKRQRKASQVHRVRLEEIQQTMRDRGQKVSLAMVDWFRQGHQINLLRTVIIYWHKDSLSEAAVKRQRRAEKQHRDEMERLRHEGRSKGAVGSQRMADRFHKSHMEAVLLEVLTVWHKVVLAAAAEEREKRARLLAQEEMLQMRALQRQRDARTVELVSTQLSRRHCAALLVDSMAAWRNVVVARVAQHEQRKLRAQHESELVGINRKKQIERDKLINMLSRMFTMHQNVAVMLNLFSDWRATAAAAVHEHRERERKRQHAIEIEQQHRQRRLAAESAAHTTSSKLFQRHHLALLWDVVADWRALVLSEARLRADQERQTRHEEELRRQRHREWLARGNTASWTADKLFQRHLLALLWDVVANWRVFVLSEVRLRVEQERQARHEEELRRQKHREWTARGKAMSWTADKLFQRHRLTLLWDIVADWRAFVLSEVRLRGDQERQSRIEEQLRRQKYNEWISRGKAVSWAAAKLHESHQFSLLFEALAGWRSGVLVARHERERRAHARQQVQKMDKQKHRALESRKQALERATLAIWRRSSRAVVQDCIVEWAKMAVRERAERQVQSTRQQVADQQEEFMRRERLQKALATKHAIAKLLAESKTTVLKECLVEWSKAAVVERTERTAREARQQLEDQLAERRLAEVRDKDRILFMLSDVHSTLSLQQVMGEWNRCAAIERIERQLRVTREQHKTDKHKAAMWIACNHGARAVLQTTWAEWVANVRAEIVAKEHQDALSQHKLTLSEHREAALKHSMERGERVALMLAERWRSGLLQVCVASWHKEVLAAQAEQRGRDLDRQHARELEHRAAQGRDKQRLMGERAVVSLMGAHAQALLQYCVLEWRRSSQVARNASSRAAAENALRQDAAAKQSSLAQRVRVAVALVAESRSGNVLLQAQMACFLAWRALARLEAAEASQLQALEEVRMRFEEDAQQLVRAHALRTDFLSRCAFMAKSKGERALLLQLCVSAWGEEAKVGRLRSAMHQARAGHEDDLAQLVHRHADQRHHARLQEQGRYLDLREKLMKLRVFAAWSQIRGVEKKKVADTARVMRSEHELATMKERTTRKVERMTVSMGELVSRLHRRFLGQLLLASWRAAAAAGLTAAEMVRRADRYRSQLAEQQELLLGDRDAVAARLHGELELVGLEAHVHRILVQWHRVSSEMRFLRGQRQDLAQQRQQYEAAVRRQQLDERDRRHGFTSRSAALLAIRSRGILLMGCFRAWREGQLRERHTLAVEAHRAEVFRLKDVAHKEAQKAESRQENALLNIAQHCNHVRAASAEELMMVLCFGEWRRANMVLKRVQRRQAAEARQEAIGRVGEVLDVVTSSLAQKRDSLELSFFMGQWWLMVCDAKNQRTLQQVRDENEQRIKQNRAEHMETLAVWLVREQTHGVGARWFAAWRGAATGERLEREHEEWRNGEALEGEKNIAMLSGALEDSQDRLFLVMARVHDRVRAQRCFSALHTAVLLARAEASGRERIAAKEDGHAGTLAERAKAKRQHAHRVGAFMASSMTRVQRRQQLTLVAAAWLAAARQDREVRQKEQFSKLHIVEKTRAEENVLRLSACVDRFTDWLCQVVVVAWAVRCLWAWRASSHASLVDRRLEEVRVEADGRAVALRRMQEEGKEAAIWRAGEVLHKVDTHALLRVALSAWRRVRQIVQERRRMDKLKQELEQELQRQRRQFNGALHNVRSKWEAGLMNLAAEVSKSSLLRCMVGWAQQVRVSRTATEARRSVVDVQELLRDSEQKLFRAEAKAKKSELLVPTSSAALPDFSSRADAPGLASQLGTKPLPLQWEAFAPGSVPDAAAAAAPATGAVAAAQLRCEGEPASQGSSVGATLDYLARARRLVESAGLPGQPPPPPEPSDVQGAAAPSGSEGAAAPSGAEARGTIAEQARLQAQLHQLQQTMAGIDRRGAGTAAGQ
ncbi:unnamed protein product [Prorocentrum cordatum]|uniref:Sfi1 spindle body domain-containing protein n=1 Tax=Prorocentrum cordatum TaxID=2364126 RepID=A0ABN9Q6D4_9DINO|nr:unnamed protein product [Polarella glacialis]